MLEIFITRPPIPSICHKVIFWVILRQNFKDAKDIIWFRIAASFFKANATKKCHQLHFLSSEKKLFFFYCAALNLRMEN